MSDGGSLRQSIGALDGILGRDVRQDGSIGLYGCEVGDETVQTETHRGPRKKRVESRACIGAGAALPSGGTVKEGVLRDAANVVTKYDLSARDPR